MRPRRWQRSALHWAVLNNHHGVIEVLVAGGAALDYETSQGDTALTVACTNNALEALLALAQRL